MNATQSHVNVHWLRCCYSFSFSVHSLWSVYISRWFVSDRHSLAFTKLAERPFGFCSSVCIPVFGFELQAVCRALLLSVSVFVRWLIVVLTVLGEASVRREGFVLSSFLKNLLTFLLVVAGFFSMISSSLQLKFPHYCRPGLTKLCC
jgi:hypothetical protein